MIKEYPNTIDLNIDDIRKLINKKIVIYGAGIYGCILLGFLELKGLKDNVICFAVSDRNENQKYVLGKPVLQLDDIYVDSDETVFIVAMNEKKACCVIEKLNRKRISGLYWFSKDSFLKVERNIKQKIFEKYNIYPIQKNKVFIYCYEGMGYCCNCKYIAEEFLRGGYPVKLVWALKNTEDETYIPKAIQTVLINTEAYFKELYTSSIIIVNDGIDFLALKRNGQFCINTWHGYGPFKKVGAALTEIDTKAYSYYDLFISASKFYSQVYRESFLYNGEVLECGAPRNDIFFSEKYKKERLYHQYGIPDDKRILLFAPTFRNDKAAAFDMCSIDMLKVLNAMENRFGKDFVLMYRFHRVLHQSEKRINFYKNGIDMTLYPDIQELLVAADVVITDYSSLMWDFSLQRKPVFLYQRDAKEYENNRGFYVPVSEWPYPQAHTQDELLELIEHFDNEAYLQELNLFLEKYGSCDDGHASERVVKRIMEVVER